MVDGRYASASNSQRAALLWWVDVSAPPPIRHAERPPCQTNSSNSPSPQGLPLPFAIRNSLRGRMPAAFNQSVNVLRTQPGAEPFE